MFRLLQGGAGVRWILVVAGLAGAAFAQTPDVKRDAGGYPAPTPKLERGRTVYVISSCHFCHGIDLTGAAMGAADLLHLPMVGNDEDGNLIGAIVRAGLPNLQTAMPQYPEYTPQQISDLAAYIHYLRRQGRYRELTGAAGQGGGDVVAGAAYFNGGAGKCNGCHSVAGDLAGIGAKYEPSRLRSRLLVPGPEGAISSEGASAGLTAHLKLLERYGDVDVRNLVAYLQTVK
jgi:cytochrome c oxidase cbb3-type subunit III